ncbi:SGNH/GDSL hydrolase family protein [Leptospira wolffii]|uniref:SGNH/GDSL hydrolase family protein n=1 Tax=Leptospira wolffii TaxID=409998 RepID=UPI0002DB8CB1|nr:SGNH/GDSL hydrolase family protein [Leptospira wolffii]EPG68240.1 GDSL-like lipase/acylhydrolase family protein [Leptospira wolffii serovar Khorat str. Khorat-H2]
MKRYVLLCFITIFASNLTAQVYYEGNGRQLDCDTMQDQISPSNYIQYLQYDSKTTVTMYGDSRSDFGDFPPYNYTNMNALVGADIVNWNVQNFGVAGWTTSDLIDHLLKCFVVFPNGSPVNPNYITANKVAFEIGGNDMYYASPFFYVAPWLVAMAVERARTNVERIISVFQRRNKKILLIGNYPAGGIVSQGKNFSEPLKTPLLSLGFATSLGMGALEGYYPEMSSRRQIEYLRVWDELALFPGALVPRADLTFIDLIHPSPAGFQVWGRAVGNKFRSLGWHVPDTLPEAPPPDIDDTIPDGTINPTPPPPPPLLDPLLLCFLLKICHQ